MILPSRQAIAKWLRTYGKSIVITAVVVFFIRWKVVEPFYIPSPSMEPTLRPSDRILVNKLKLSVSEPQRWDVLVFKDPRNPSRNLIKRLVGLPGETLQIIDGDIQINGRKIEKPQSIRSVFYMDDSLEYGPYGTFEPVRIPENCYFFLGDNSRQSNDSRWWSFVNGGDLIGEAITIIWPLARVQFIR
ncbi:MAG TPA: signal peptidase I [Planctomycetota bacterium]|nr:signal peptidase I [Planctomycetota bacterium]